MACNTKTCPGCGQQIDVINFSCPNSNCKAIQPAGTVSLTTRKPTTIVAVATQGSGKRLTTLPAIELAEGGCRQAVDVAVITFNEKAEVVVPLSPVGQVGPIEIKPAGFTNGAGALEKAHQLLHGDPDRMYRKSAVCLLSDGDFNRAGGGFLGFFEKDPVEAAIKWSKELQAKGTRVGTIYFAGDDESTRDALRKVASSPSLFVEAGNGQLMRAMLSLTRTMTQVGASVQQATLPGIAVVFLIDASGSMDEGKKKSEAQTAFLKCAEDLRAM